MRLLLFTAIIMAAMAAQQKIATISEFLTGEWQIYESVPEKEVVEEIVEEVVEEVVEIKTEEIPETVEEKTEEVKEVKEAKETEEKPEERIPVLSFNITKRTDVEGILDLLLPKEQEETEQEIKEEVKEDKKEEKA